MRHVERVRPMKLVLDITIDDAATYLTAYRLVQAMTKLLVEHFEADIERVSTRLERSPACHVTREKGSLSETIARLEAMVMEQGGELREMRSQLTAARSEIGELRQRLDRNGGA